MRDIATKIQTNSGIGLIIDYGYHVNNLIRVDFNPTIQSIKDHKYNPVLNAVGDADITAHVDFFAIRNAALARGVNVDEVITQGEFLLNMGIMLRAEILKQKASAKDRADIDAALQRLVSPDHMGNLFKVLQFWH
jgi:SAM-dependent MidA family methyltransferase